MYEVRSTSYCDFMHVAHKPAQSNGCNPLQKKFGHPCSTSFQTVLYPMGHSVRSPNCGMMCKVL